MALAWLLHATKAQPWAKKSRQTNLEPRPSAPSLLRENGAAIHNLNSEMWKKNGTVNRPTWRHGLPSRIRQKSHLKLLSDCPAFY